MRNLQKYFTVRINWYMVLLLHTFPTCLVKPMPCIAIALRGGAYFFLLMINRDTLCTKFFEGNIFLNYKPIHKKPCEISQCSIRLIMVLLKIIKILRKQQL